MPKKSSTSITEISGYSVLPIKLPVVSPSLPEPVTHYVYLRPHEPRIPDPDAARSLFLVNVPIDTTELHLRHLFSSQLSAGRVERVQFEGVFRSSTTTTTTPTAAIEADTSDTQQQQQQGKKRKRQEVVTSAELETQLRAAGLPSTWDRELYSSGSHAIVTFVDRPAMEASLKAVRKYASKEKETKKSKIIWGEGIEDRVAALGTTRYRKHVAKLRYPPAGELLSIVNNYMSLYTQWEETRAAEASRRAAEPDEDGFITVTRGPRFTDVAREEEVRELVEKQRKREEGLGDFYRFQTREKRKERQNELLRRFDEDKRKIEKLKMSRGRIMVCSLLFF